MEYIFTYQSKVLVRNEIKFIAYDEIKDLLASWNENQIALNRLNENDPSFGVQALIGTQRVIDKSALKQVKYICKSSINDRTTVLENNLVHINLTEHTEYMQLRSQIPILHISYLEFLNLKGIELKFPFVEYIGMQESDAIALANKNDYYVEVTERDDDIYAQQAYYSDQRLSFKIKNNIVQYCSQG